MLFIWDYNLIYENKKKMLVKKMNENKKMEAKERRRFVRDFITVSNVTKALFLDYGAS